MIPLACFLLMITQPPTVVIATPRGETIVPLALERGSAAVAAAVASAALGLTVAPGGAASSAIMVAAAFVSQIGVPIMHPSCDECGVVRERELTRDPALL